MRARSSTKVHRFDHRITSTSAARTDQTRGSEATRTTELKTMAAFMSPSFASRCPTGRRWSSPPPAARRLLETGAMGRIFETRKATMFKRWDKMAKAFTRIGKDIAIAVKAGGPSVENNPALRRVIQNARAANMPKDKIENAIKKASG